jgi:hypothetical protein
VRPPALCERRKCGEARPRVGRSSVPILARAKLKASLSMLSLTLLELCTAALQSPVQISSSCISDCEVGSTRQASRLQKPLCFPIMQFRLPPT